MVHAALLHASRGVGDFGPDLLCMGMPRDELFRLLQAKATDVRRTYGEMLTKTASCGMALASFSAMKERLESFNNLINETYGAGTAKGLNRVLDETCGIVRDDARIRNYLENSEGWQALDDSERRQIISQLRELHTARERALSGETLSGDDIPRDLHPFLRQRIEQGFFQRMSTSIEGMTTERLAELGASHGAVLRGLGDGTIDYNSLPENVRTVLADFGISGNDVRAEIFNLYSTNPEAFVSIMERFQAEKISFSMGGPRSTSLPKGVEVGDDARVLSASFDGAGAALDPTWTHLDLSEPRYANATTTRELEATATA